MEFKMPPKVLKALEGSICKWENICMGHGEERGYIDCPLCTLFYLDKDCYGCPVVMLRTGRICCEDTPYYEWDEEWKNYNKFIMSTPLEQVHDEVYTPIFAEVAEKELIFLLGLLPEGHPWREMI